VKMFQNKMSDLSEWMQKKKRESTRDETFI
jgi:hypothetical protein